MTNNEKYRKLVFRIETLERLINVLWVEYWLKRGDLSLEDLDRPTTRTVNSISVSIRDHGYTLLGLKRRKKELGETILNSIEKGETL